MSSRVIVPGLLIGVLVAGVPAMLHVAAGKPQANASALCRHLAALAEHGDGGDARKMSSGVKDRPLAAFVSAANRFFRELERDEQFVLEHPELPLGGEESDAKEIATAIGTDDKEALKDYRVDYLQSYQDLEPDLRAKLNELVRGASGYDFDDFKADLLKRAGEMVLRGTLASAEEYNDLLRYRDFIWDPHRPSDHQRAVERLVARYSDEFDCDHAQLEARMVERAEEIFERGVIASAEEH